MEHVVVVKGGAAVGHNYTCEGDHTHVPTNKTKKDLQQLRQTVLAQEWAAAPQTLAQLQTCST